MNLLRVFEVCYLAPGKAAQFQAEGGSETCWTDTGLRLLLLYLTYKTLLEDEEQREFHCLLITFCSRKDKVAERTGQKKSLYPQVFGTDPRWLQNEIAAVCWVLLPYVH